MTTELQHLFSPLFVGPFELRNRLICTGHNPHYDTGGLIGSQQTAFHVRKAQGGIALSVTGATSVHPSGPDLPVAPLINFDDSVIPGYRQLAEQMHAAGAKMLVQLSHAASAAPSGHSGHALWSPSLTIGEFALELPHVMTKAEIEIVLHAFIAAAARVKASGLDGVEINAFAGGIVQQFLSPDTNHRTDEYGGTPENRLRFLFELLRGCRLALGSDRALTLKLAGDELYEDGLHLADMQEIVQRIDRAGLIDFYVVASGNNLKRIPRVDHWPPTPAPYGLHVPLAEGIKRVSTRPVAALCRIIDPRMADELIASGKCDLVAMVRATIADPDIARKAAEGRFDEIRPCVGANVCVDRIIDGGQTRCIHNAVIGHEREWGTLEPAPTPRHVLVVGGGPAGLEAARVAAEKGHRVTLFERGQALGGGALVLARAPGRKELAGIPNWLAQQVRRLGVEVRLQTEATVAGILAEQPDVVILASGARDTAPQLTQAGVGLPVVSAYAILSGQFDPGSNVLVVDHTGYNVGCAVAELVTDRGGQAEVVSRHFHPAVAFGLTNTVSLYKRLFAKKVTLTPHHELTSAKDGVVTIANYYSREERAIRGLDMLVLVTLPAAEDGLLAPLTAAGLEVLPIGDCVAPRDVETAIFEGHRAGRQV